MTVSEDKASVYSGEGSVRRGPIEAERPKPGPEYVLPTCTGAINHDPTKLKGPSYSIGMPYKREKSMVPGPKYAYGDNVTTKGAQNPPKYSLQSRPSVKAIEITPGPGQYDTGKVSYGAISSQPTPRATAVVGKERYQYKSFAPAVTKYAVPYTFGVGAPDKTGGRQWTIGAKRDYGGNHYEGQNKAAPCSSRYAAVDPSIYARKAPAFSTGGRTKVPSYNTSQNAPGPGTYEARSSFGRSGGPTFGARHSTFVMPVYTQSDFIHC